MKRQKTGSRHTLLLYQRYVNRIWKLTLFLGLVLAFFWVWRWINIEKTVLFSTDTLLLAAAVLAFILTIFFFFARYMSYVQPYEKYLKVVTPFLRMNLSYRRMRSVRPVLVQQIFPKEDSKRSQRNALEPFYGKTAVIIELKKFPVSESMLRLFLPSTMFTRQFTGLVLIIPDWMKLSTEIDTYRGLQSRSIKDRAWQEDSQGW